MKQRSLFIFCLVTVTAGVAGAQTASITNADLEKYRHDRLKGERDYAENYGAMGFPSPAERNRRIAESRSETEQLSARLRAERLELERLDAFRHAESMRAAAQQRQQVYVEQNSQGGWPGYGWSYGTPYRQRLRNFRGQSGYFAGGQFWPTPRVRHSPRPMLVQRRHYR